MHNRFLLKTKKWLCYSLSIFLISSTLVHAKSNFTYQIHGLSGDALVNAKDRLIAMQKEYGEHFSSIQIRKLYIQGASEIKKGIEPYGYFKSRISSQLIRQHGQWLAVYFVLPGEPMHIKNLQVEVVGPGHDNLVINKYLNNFPLHVNDVFVTPVYDKAKTKLFARTRNQGYLQAFYKNQIVVNLPQNTCSIVMHLETGPQYYFGSVSFESYPYSEEFMRKFFNFNQEDYFSSRRIIKLQQAMEKSYYFKRAVLIPDFRNIKDYHVPIKADLVPPKPYRYSLGFGYGTLTGPRLSAGFSIRHLGNEGHHIETEMKLSKVISAASATYYMPGKNPLTDEWLAGVNYKHFNPKAGISNSVTATVGYSKKFAKAQSSISLNYLRERFVIYGYPGQAANELYPSWKTSYIVADNLTNPKNAHSVNLTVQGASKAILSTTSFIQAQTRIKWIVSPVSFARILMRVDLGAAAVHNLPVFPMSLRYFAGGVTTIRGFADSSIGPGKYLAVGSLEYQQRLKEGLYAAVFYDAGSAANHFKSRLNRGVGVGAIYDTRVGPIKIYLARAVSKHTKPYSIEFSVGPEFS